MADLSLLQQGGRESTRAINGVTLHVVEAGDPGRPLLLLLHGFPEFWWAWRQQITPLAQAPHAGAAFTYVAFFQLPWVPEATLGGFDFAGLKAMMQGAPRRTRSSRTRWIVMPRRGGIRVR